MARKTGTERCACGSIIKSSQINRHMRNGWHDVAPKARLLRKAGLSYIEVWRQLGPGRRITRQAVWLQLKEEGL